MKDSDKVILVYRYFFYKEVFYQEQINNIMHTCKSKSSTIDDYYRLIRARIEQETFERIMTDILTLFNPHHF